jgi:O-antigen chain-terminating methyltransferase
MTAAGQVITNLHDELLEVRTQTHNEVATGIDEISGALKALEHDFAALRGNRDLLFKSQQDLAAELRSAQDAAADARDQGQRATESLQQLREETGATTERLSALENATSRAGTRLESLEKGLAAVGNASPAVDRLAKLENDLPLHIRRIGEVLERAGEHLRNLQSQVDRETIQHERFHELEKIVARLEQRMTDDGTYLKAEVAQHRAVIARLNEPNPTSRQRIKPALNRGLLDAFYLTFEDRFRGARPDIKKRLKFYLPFIRTAGAGSTEFPVLDVGCGRGEWLELLKDNDLAAKGVDLNATMQAQCVERGLDVAHADVLDYLRTLPDGQLGALTGFHIIEHLPLETLLDLVSQTYRVLRPGGVVIFESPNCKNLVVGACTFYLDPTHRNPVVPETAEFILESHGFVKSEINYLWPIKGSPFKSKSAESKLLNAYFFGPQDFSVVGFKTPLK